MNTFLVVVVSTSVIIPALMLGGPFRNLFGLLLSSFIISSISFPPLLGSLVRVKIPLLILTFRPPCLARRPHQLGGREREQEREKERERENHSKSLGEGVGKVKIQT